MIFKLFGNSSFKRQYTYLNFFSSIKSEELVRQETGYVVDFDRIKLFVRRYVYYIPFISTKNSITFAGTLRVKNVVRFGRWDIYCDECLWLWHEWKERKKFHWKKYIFKKWARSFDTNQNNVMYKGMNFERQVSQNCISTWIWWWMRIRRETCFTIFWQA